MFRNARHGVIASCPPRGLSLRNCASWRHGRWSGPSALNLHFSRSEPSGTYESKAAIRDMVAENSGVLQELQLCREDGQDFSPGRYVIRLAGSRARAVMLTALQGLRR